MSGLVVVAALAMLLTVLVVPEERVGAAAPDTTAFIDGAYLLFLGRHASSSEVEHWSRLVDYGDRASLTRTLATSEEWAGVRVDELYRKILRRPSEPEGRAYWLERIRAGHRLEDIAALFYGSEEYWIRSNRSAGTFVDNLYRDLLGRSPDASGRSYWIGRLGQGVSRQDIAGGFYASVESRNDRVRTLYHEVLGRSPDPEGLAYWANHLIWSGDIALSSWLAESREFYRRVTGHWPPPPSVIRLRGDGSRTFQLNLLGQTIVRSYRPGSGHFSITMLDRNRNFLALAANETAPYLGEQLVADRWSDTRFVEVKADGPWVVELMPLVYAAPLDLANGSGITDQVVRVSVPTARSTRFQYRGDSNFIVVARDGEGRWLKLLVNRTGDTNVTTVVPAGTVFLQVAGKGSWTTR